MKARHHVQRNGGFTLPELTVTLVIVAMALVWILQGIHVSMSTASHTHHRKVARNLGLLTLGRLQSGLYWEEMDDRLYGTYAEDGYADWHWEVAVGDEALSDISQNDPTLAYDSWNPDGYGRNADEDEDDDDDDEGAREPYETVRIRVTFPKINEWSNELLIERWVPWDQIYGPQDDDGLAGDGASGDDS